MARIYEETVVVKLSRLVKDTEVTPMIATEDVVTALEQVAQELVGEHVIAEVSKLKHNSGDTE